MQTRRLLVVIAALIFAAASQAQTSNPSYTDPSDEGQSSSSPAASKPAPTVKPVYARGAWEYGPFLNGGLGTGDRSSFHFFSAGFHAGKVLTNPAGPGFLKGQFEYAADVIPFWQSYTPAPHLAPVTYKVNGIVYHGFAEVGGGTFTGVSVTPIILRWNMKGTAKFMPFAQGAGGLIWTNHKYPPDFLVTEGTPGGTSVWNFTPQFGVGFQYFVKPRRSISVNANAIHISSASLGDRNPGVNASVQFQVGYNWWK